MPSAGTEGAAAKEWADVNADSAGKVEFSGTSVTHNGYGVTGSVYGVISNGPAGKVESSGRSSSGAPDTRGDNK